MSRQSDVQGSRCASWNDVLTADTGASQRPPAKRGLPVPSRRVDTHPSGEVVMRMQSANAPQQHTCCTSFRSRIKKSLVRLSGKPGRFPGVLAKRPRVAKTVVAALHELAGIAVDDENVAAGRIENDAISVGLGLDPLDCFERVQVELDDYSGLAHRQYNPCRSRARWRHHGCRPACPRWCQSAHRCRP